MTIHRVSPSAAGDPIDGVAPWIRHVPVFAAAFGVILGAVALIGWAADIEILKSVIPGQVTLKPNTATGIIAAAVSLLLLTPADAGRARRRVGRALALGLGFLGLATVAEYVLGRDLGIDQLLFREAPGAIATRFPGRMSLAAAVTFTVFGVALLLIDRPDPRLRRIIALCLSTVSVVCFAAVTAHLFGSSLPYLAAPGASTALSFPGALGLLILATGLRVARPMSAFDMLTRDGWGGAVMRRSVLGTIAGIWLLGLFVEWLARRATLTHDQEVTVVIVAVTVIALVSVDRAVRLVHRSRSELSRAEEESDLFFRLSRDMLCVADLDGTFLRLNPAWETTLGWSVKELTSRPFIEFVHPDDLAATNAEAARLARGGQTTSFENRYRCKDGSYRWLLWSVIGVPERGLLLGIARDISEYKDAEVEREHLTRELEANAERVRDLFDHAPVGYHSLGPDGVFVEINDTELTWLGYERDEVIGKMRFSDVSTPASVEIFRREFPLFMQRGFVRDLEYELVRRDGTVFPVLINSTAVTDEDGGFVRSRSTITDLTERKQAERLIDEAREEAERANRAKDEFLSRMSHELRTPLNAVLGFAQLLELDDLTPEQRAGTAQIIKGGHHLQELIDEILDISRIASGNLSLSTEPVALAPVVRDVVALTQPLATARPVSLRVDPSGDDWVQADRQRLSQILLNLVGNAIKYNRDGGEVRVSWSLAGGRVRVWVDDTGPGIPADVVDRLFTPFDRLGVESSTTEGTGLGLALSKGLAEAMDGSIEVQSEPGHGSRFTLVLPAAEWPEVSDASEPPPPTPVAPSGDTRIVLYIEDNPANIRLVERVLDRRPNVRLLTALQGRPGLDLAREHRPDLILLDAHLPDISGEQLLRELRADETLAYIPVVAISADATAGQRAVFFALGADDYVTKPFDVARLLEVVDGVLARDPSAATEERT